MLKLDSLALDASRGRWLELSEYSADFQRVRSAISGTDSWKFERRQHFQENTAGRNAVERGDWAAAMDILASRRVSFRQAVQRDRANRMTFRRLRIVAEPLTPYVQWELHSLRVQAECGLPTRVADEAVLGDLEHAGMLPEVVVLGGQHLYNVVYDAAGVPLGAYLFTDSDLIENWIAFIADRYYQAEDVVSYFDRRVAGLPPPTMKGAGHSR